MSEDIVEVKIKKSEVSFVVWFVPFIALVVGGWMIYQYYAKMGPMITITFKNSGGLEPRQSQVKFRDVKVGVVEKVEILKQKEGVKVYARMNKDVTPFLNKHTKFWIVKPEIDIGKVRGLDALMSGSYIQMYSDLDDEEEVLEFKGLDDPPLSLKEEHGKTYKLISPTSYDLSPGTAVYFKQMIVGRVKWVNLTKDGKNVEIYVFIKDPYNSYINVNTRFWNLKNFNINLTDQGIRVDAGSLSQILLGGIEFDTKEFSNALKKRDTFYLYPSKDEAWQKRIGRGKEKYVDFVMQFDEGVGYLSIGASIRLDGFVIGKVKDIISYFDSKNLKTNSLVIATIDISAFEQGKKSAFFGLRQAIKNGLSAKLEPVNPLINYMYIKLVKGKKGAELVKDGKYYVFPTQKSSMDDLVSSMKKIVSKLEDLPLKKAVKNFSDSFLSIKNLSNDINKIVKDKNMQNLPKDLSNSLKNLNIALEDFSKLAKSYEEDSKFSKELSQTLKDIDKASKELGKVLKKVKTKPNSLIFGD